MRATTYRQERSHIWISLLLGASGAFVLYTLVGLPGLLTVDVKAFVTDPQRGFVPLVIAAGYSERLWRGALDKLAEKFPTREREDQK